MTRTWEISTVTDAARARIATARVAADCGVPPLERTRLAAALGTRLRRCLAEGGVWRLALTPDDKTLRVELTSSPPTANRRG